MKTFKTFQNRDKPSEMSEDVLKSLEESSRTAIYNFYNIDEFRYRDAINESEYTEDEINEALGPMLILSVLLAMPKVIELIVKAISIVIKTLKNMIGMKQSDETKIADTIIGFTHKWHKSYIKAIQFVLEKAKVFEKAKIVDDEDKKKAAEVVFYTIIFGFVVYGGIASVSAIAASVHNASHAGMATAEVVLTSVKTTEVKSFVTKFM